MSIQKVVKANAVDKSSLKISQLILNKLQNRSLLKTSKSSNSKDRLANKEKLKNFSCKNLKISQLTVKKSLILTKRDECRLDRLNPKNNYSSL